MTHGGALSAARLGHLWLDPILPAVLPSWRVFLPLWKPFKQSRMMTLNGQEFRSSYANLDKAISSVLETLPGATARLSEVDKVSPAMQGMFASSQEGFIEDERAELLL